MESSTVKPDHSADDTIIASAETLLRDRAAKFLTHASNIRGDKSAENEYKDSLNIAARCTMAATNVESVLQSISDFDSRYPEGEPPHAAA